MNPLRAIVANLPKDLPAALFVVMHISPGSPGLLPDILNHWDSLPAMHANHGDEIRMGKIYVAPPDHHLLVHRGVMHVSKGPRENRFRRAIDPLFRTAARAYGPQVAAVLLSGGLNDGTYGMMVVKQKGGVAVVQDPQHAEMPDMLNSAIEKVETDYVVPVAEIAPLLARLAEEPALALSAAGNPGNHDPEDPAESEDMGLPHRPPHGKLAPLVCPECGGSLWESVHGKLTRYRCHEGHAFTAESLLSEQTDAIEEALWTALRSLDENGELLRRMAQRARMSNRPNSADAFEEQAQESEERADLLRRVLLEKEE